MGHGGTGGRGATATAKSDRSGDHGSSQSRGRGSPTAAAAAAGRRITRSRARELGLTLEIAWLPQLGCRKGHKPKEELMGNQNSAAVGGGGDDSLASTFAGPQPEPRSHLTSNHPKPRSERTRRPNAEALSVNKLLAGAPWLVHVSSTSPDGKEILRCSGMTVRWEKEAAWILTSYRVAYCTLNNEMYDPMPKLAVHVTKAVHLPNNGIFEGHMLFFNEHYQLAVLKIEVETMFEMEHPRYSRMPCYGDNVLAMARDERLSFDLQRGTVTCLEEDHFLFISCKLCPCGIGGPVINDAGDVMGIVCDNDEDPAILSSTTIHTCIEMWTNFGRVARPVLGMYLRSVFLLDMEHHERLRCKYGINNGFIVDEVIIHSVAEKRGVRRGNVITSFDGISCCLPEFENMLLSIGMAFLDGMKQMNDFKLEVHDLLGQAKRTIILPVQISDGSEH